MTATAATVSSHPAPRVRPPVGPVFVLRDDYFAVCHWNPPAWYAFTVLMDKVQSENPDSDADELWTTATDDEFYMRSLRMLDYDMIPYALRVLTENYELIEPRDGGFVVLMKRIRRQLESLPKNYYEKFRSSLPRGDWTDEE